MAIFVSIETIITTNLLQPIINNPLILRGNGFNLIKISIKTTRPIAIVEIITSGYQLVTSNM